REREREAPVAQRPPETLEEIRRTSLIPDELWEQEFPSASLLASAVTEASGLPWKVQDKPRSITCDGGVPRPNFECGCCVLIKSKAKQWKLHEFRTVRGVKCNTHSDACQHKAQLPIRHVEYPIAETAIPEILAHLDTRTDKHTQPIQVLAALTDNEYLLEGGFVLTLSSGAEVPTGTMGPECEVERVEVPAVEKEEADRRRMWNYRVKSRYLTVGPEVFRYDKGKLHVMDIATREWREEPYSQDTPDCDADRSSLFALDHDLYLLGSVVVPVKKKAKQQPVFGDIWGRMNYRQSQVETEETLWRFDTDTRRWHRLPAPPVKDCQVLSVVGSRVYVCRPSSGEVYSYAPGTAGTDSVGEGAETPWEEEGVMKLPEEAPDSNYDGTFRRYSYRGRRNVYNPSMITMGRYIVPLRPDHHWHIPPFVGYDTISQGVTDDFSEVTLAPLDMRQAHAHCTARDRPPVAHVLEDEFIFRVLQVDTAYEEDC
ncbi:hypothetical protein KIPB_006516, partial [Kipferlia bialata]